MLALGVYPAVSLAKARQKSDRAKQLLADGIDPSAAKRQEKAERTAAAANTFAAIAREWLIRPRLPRSNCPRGSSFGPANCEPQNGLN